MDVLNLGDEGSPFRWQTEKDLGTSVARLSSGLRINTAADDPSGLAISESLRALSNGYQRGAQNVQDAVNALSVADGALETVTQLVQRLRSLAVQANSDITSLGDRQLLQAEFDQIRLEINRIAQNSSFNGRNLLDGSLTSPRPPQNAYTVQLAAPLNPQTGDSNETVANATASVSPQPGPLVSNVTFGNNLPGAYFQVDVLGPDAAGNIILRQTVYSSDPAFGPSIQEEAPIPPDAGPNAGTGQPYLQISNPNGNGGVGTIALTFDLANVGLADVGTSMAFLLVPSTAAQTGGHALSVQSGAAEGATTSIEIQGVSTADLGIADITLLPPGQMIDENGNPTFDSASSNLSATYAEAKIDIALQQVDAERARIGAQVVSLREDGTNDAIQQTSLTASQSTIRDLNVAQETTRFTRLSLTDQMQKRLLRSVDDIAMSVYQLLAANFP
jgi:flagellin